jgi:inorganic pyrophosphatase
MAALGMLSTLAIGLTIDGYGPISDNAGGITEICKLGEHVRERTDALDAAGNTTAANGKGFATGSAALVSLALFSTYTVRAEIPPAKLSLLEPMVVCGLLVGAMLSYVFSGMTMKSVGLAAMTMVPTPHPKPPLLPCSILFGRLWRRALSWVSARSWKSTRALANTCWSTLQHLACMCAV